MTSGSSVNSEAITRPFGQANRLRLLDEWFTQYGDPTPDAAWKHVYRLLLWIDRTIGLAHCYESDKAQPGRPWYPRTLRFHGWVADQLGVSPQDLGGQIDWLFGRATDELVAALPELRAERSAAAERQRVRNDAEDYPLPGDDPELHDILENALSDVAGPLPAEIKRDLTERIGLYMSQENRRRNLIGEGFEDTIAAITERSCAHRVLTRRRLNDLPGFHPARPNEKVRKVDLAVLADDMSSPNGVRRILVTAKWSVRADREEQFATDYRDYERLEAWGEHFDYVWITNEFDPARLVAASERRVGNTLLFTSIVHIQPEALAAVYGSIPSRSQPAALAYVEDGRIISFSEWLGQLSV